MLMRVQLLLGVRCGWCRRVFGLLSRLVVKGNNCGGPQTHTASRRSSIGAFNIVGLWGRSSTTKEVAWVFLPLILEGPDCPIGPQIHLLPRSRCWFKRGSNRMSWVSACVAPVLLPLPRPLLTTRSANHIERWAQSRVLEPLGTQIRWGPVSAPWAPTCG